MPNASAGPNHSSSSVGSSSLSSSSASQFHHESAVFVLFFFCREGCFSNKSCLRWAPKLQIFRSADPRN